MRVRGINHNSPQSSKNQPADLVLELTEWIKTYTKIQDHLDFLARNLIEPVISNQQVFGQDATRLDDLFTSHGWSGLQ